MNNGVSPFGGFLFMLMAFFAGACQQADYKTYYDGVVEELSSETYYGRSVFGNGDIKAARFIMDQLSAIDGIVADGTDCRCLNCVTACPPYKSEVAPCDAGRWNSESDKERYLPYLQSFQFPMNVMRGAMSVELDGKALKACVDFTAKEFSPSCHGVFDVAYLPAGQVTEKNFVSELNSGRYAGSFVVVDWEKYLQLPAHPFERYVPYLGRLDKVGGLIFKGDDLFPYFKARSYYSLNMPVLMVDRNFPEDAKSVKVDIDAEMIPSRDAHNIVAWLPGTDSLASEYVCFIAHYDHLGMMGRDNVFPGANDNASGVAMLLALAKYYSVNRPAHGIQFVFLDAEEANLLGSFYYCENPSRPLAGISALIDLDMIADNGDHLSAEASESGMDILRAVRALNADDTFPPFDIVLEDFTDVSDHYSFGLKDVPALYFSTEGDFYRYYHTPQDKSGNISNENFERLFSLFTRLVK